MANQNQRSHDVFRVYSRALETARAGIRSGFTNRRILFRNTAWLAHCERGSLQLLDAHMLALEATREALREVAAK